MVSLAVLLKPSFFLAHSYRYYVTNRIVLKSLRFICLQVLCMQLCWVAGLPHLVHHFYRHEYAHHYSSNAIVTSSSTMHCLFFNCHPLEHESIKNWPMEHLNKLVEFFAKFHLYLYPNWPSLSEHTWKQRSVSIGSLDCTFLCIHSL